MRVSTADFIKNFGAISDQALAEPVRITKHGRDRLVVVSAAEYDRLKRADRRVVLAQDLTDEELDLIGKATVSTEFDHLDLELKTWNP